MKKCSLCNETLTFIRTTGGKFMPCNAGEVLYWPGTTDTVITPNGETARCSLTGEGEPVGMGYVPHWATCPRANAARKSKGYGHE